MMRIQTVLLVALLAMGTAFHLSVQADTETPSPSAIMSQPLDGSSEEAFRASIEKFKADAQPQEIKVFNAAIGQMLTYDLSVRHDVGKLAAKLDGKTPTEVIAMAAERW